MVPRRSQYPGQATHFSGYAQTSGGHTHQGKRMLLVNSSAVCMEYIFDVHCNEYKVQFVITNGYCNCVNIFLMFTVNNASKLCHLDSTLPVSRFL